MLSFNFLDSIFKKLSFFVFVFPIFLLLVNIFKILSNFFTFLNTPYLDVSKKYIYIFGKKYIKKSTNTQEYKNILNFHIFLIFLVFNEFFKVFFPQILYFSSVFMLCVSKN